MHFSAGAPQGPLSHPKQPPPSPIPPLLRVGGGWGGRGLPHHPRPARPPFPPFCAGASNVGHFSVWLAFAAVGRTDVAKQGFEENAAGEDRTPDLRIMRPTRCQLRYCRSWPQVAGLAAEDVEATPQGQLCADELGAQIPALGFEPRFLPRCFFRGSPQTKR